MKKEGVESVERALAILRAFSESKAEMTLTDIAERTGFYKSTVLRLAASLEACGFLVRDDARVFRLGPELWRLGALYRRQLDLGEFIRPALRRLTEATGETASFYVRDADERVCLYRHNSTRAARHHLDEGQRLPLGQGAAGHVLRAFTAPLWKPGEAIRDLGYSVSIGERDPDVGSVAVAVVDPAGRFRGALTVSGILTRFNRQAQTEALAALRREAQRLAEILPASD